MKIIKEFPALRAKTCRYSTENNDKDKKVQGIKKFVKKQKFEFEDLKICLEATQPKKCIYI